MTDELLADLVTAVATPGALASKRGLTLRDLARWAADPENRATLDALRSLADAQAGLVISRARGQAARRLLLIARNKEAPETARKACVDLLGLQSPDGGASDADAPGASAWQDEIRAMLEAAGAPAPTMEGRA